MASKKTQTDDDLCIPLPTPHIHETLLESYPATGASTSTGSSTEQGSEHRTRLNEEQAR